jgi:hypothetical protein
MGGKECMNASAEVVLSTEPSKGGSPSPKIAFPPCPEVNEKLYKLLFHGPDLQAIESIHGYSEQGMAATVRTAPKPSAWAKQPLRSNWITDPLVLDCCGQMMVLWSYLNQGAFSLPTYIGGYQQFRPFPRGKADITIRITEKKDSKAVSDIEFSDSDGMLIARMENYEFIGDSLLEEKFAKNRLD